MNRRNYLISEFRLIDTDYNNPTIYRDFFTEVLAIVQKFDEVKEDIGMSVETEGIYVRSIIDLVANALRMKPLSPITDNPDEWTYIESIDDILDFYDLDFETANKVLEDIKGLKVCKRLPNLQYRDGKVFFAKGIVFVDVVSGKEIQGPVEGVTAAPPVVLPIVPKIFVIDVYQDVSGIWRIKDRSKVSNAIDYFTNNNKDE